MGLEGADQPPRPQPGWSKTQTKGREAVPRGGEVQGTARWHSPQTLKQPRARDQEQGEREKVSHGPRDSPRAGVPGRAAGNAAASPLSVLPVLSPGRRAGGRWLRGSSRTQSCFRAARSTARLGCVGPPSCPPPINSRVDA